MHRRAVLGLALAGCVPAAQSSSLARRAPESATPLPVCDWLPRGAPQRLSASALTELGNYARASSTSSLVVLEDGRVVFEHGELDALIHVMSVTKSVTSLVIGQLVDRKLVDVEQSMADFLPPWRGTPKERIKLIHVLSHSSGLADKRTTEDIYASGDFVLHGVEAEIVSDPGTRFFYSNRATNLLARVVEWVTGRSLAAWAEEHLFAPLGISTFEWDSDPVGNTQAMGGLKLGVFDLAKIGQLVLDDGACCGREIVSRGWIERSTRRYERVGFNNQGLLWWLEPKSKRVGFTAELFRRWAEQGVPEDFIAKFRPLEGRSFEPSEFFQAVFTALTGKTSAPSPDELEPWHAMTWKAGRPDGEAMLGPVRTVVADGYGGQNVIVYPEERVVITRLRRLNNVVAASEPQRFVKVVDDLLFPRAKG